jgi:hypothetical protein
MCRCHLGSVPGQFHVVLRLAGIVGVAEQHSESVRLGLQELADPIEFFRRGRREIEIVDLEADIVDLVTGNLLLRSAFNLCIPF